MFIKLTTETGEKPLYFWYSKICFWPTPGGCCIRFDGTDWPVKESPEEILAMIEGKGPPTQPEKNPMKYHILYQSEKIASFEYKSTRDICLNYLILEYNDTKYTTPNDE